MGVFWKARVFGKKQLLYVYSRMFLIEPAKHPQKVCTLDSVKEMGLVSVRKVPPSPQGVQVAELHADSICFVC